MTVFSHIGELADDDNLYFCVSHPAADCIITGEMTKTKVFTNMSVMTGKGEIFPATDDKALYISLAIWRIKNVLTRQMDNYIAEQNRQIENIGLWPYSESSIEDFIQSEIEQIDFSGVRDNG